MQELLDKMIFSNSVEDYAYFFGSILLVLIFKRYISRMLGKLLYRVFDRLAGGNMGQRFVEHMLKPIESLVVLIAVSLAFHWLDWPKGAFWEGKLYGVGLPSLLTGLYQLLMVYVVCRLLLNLSNFIAEVMLERARKTATKQDDQYVFFIKDALRVIIYAFGLFLVIGGVLKLNITGLLAGAGLAGLAIALAAQDSLQNLLGSITIFTEKPFTVGDFIQVGDTTGIVEKVGFRSTRIRTLEKSFVTLPNKVIIDNSLNNLTLRTFRRVKTMIGLTYDTSHEQLQKIVSEIQSLLDEHKLTNQDGIVSFDEFGASSLDIQVIYYIQMIDYNPYIKTNEEINFKIMEIVGRNGADFAFPTQTVHLAKGE